jgi:hypothetical protein
MLQKTKRNSRMALKATPLLAEMPQGWWLLMKKSKGKKL